MLLSQEINESSSSIAPEDEFKNINFSLYVSRDYEKVLAQINQKFTEFNDAFSDEFTYFKQGMFKKLLDTDSKYADIENRTTQKLEELIQQIRNFIPININVNSNSQMVNNNLGGGTNLGNKGININKVKGKDSIEEDNQQGGYLQDMRILNANTQRNSKSREVKVRLR